MLKSLLIFIILLPITAFALTAEKRLDDPIKEKRAHTIFKQIRCVVCSGESINDSKADIAKSLRVTVRSKLSEGMSNGDIISYITERYGDEVLMMPPLNVNTYILWIAPFILLACGGFFICLFFRQKIVKK